MLIKRVTNYAISASLSGTV